ncbi:biliverdin-producing heme oxygenase [Novosphingobium tardum]|uniref:Biliverdin-producing heme oxygenase n=1 Tax=Novosphingobium tardum TaxID=1538021 RepID=A0ABV8RJQ0_9SPHN
MLFIFRRRTAELTPEIIDLPARDSGRAAAAMPTIRNLLRDETRYAHEALDRSLAGFELADPHSYAAFLRFHARARTGVERWLDAVAPEGSAPPSQVALIASDLGALDAGTLPSGPDFAPSPAADWLGVAYVVAGSHLGNRFLLAGAENAIPAGARRFLGGETMNPYWKALQQPLGAKATAVDARGIVAGALAAFAHFAKCAPEFAAAGRPAAA